MSDVAHRVRAAPAPAAARPSLVLIARKRRVPRPRGSAGNRGIAMVCMGIVALAPLPLGSNRPFFWMLWTLLLSIVATIFAVAVLRSRTSLRFDPDSLRVPVLLFFGLLCFLLLQALPLGNLFGPFTFDSAAGVSILSNTLSLAPGATVLMVVRLFGYGLLFVLFLQAASNPGRRFLMLRVLFLITVVYATFGLLALTALGDTMLGAPKWAYLGAATGPFVNRNSFATFLAMGLAIGTCLFLNAASGRRAGNPALLLSGPGGLYAFGMLVLAGALIATHSRMGFFASLAGVGAILGVMLARGTSSRLAVAAIALAVCGGFAAALALYGNELFERLGSLDAASDVRGSLFLEVFDMIRQRPLLGWGGGSFETAFPLVHGPAVSTDLVWDKAHSTYLTLWTELGLVAGSLPILGAVVVGSRAFAVARRGEPGGWEALAAFGVLVVVGVHSLVDFSLEIEANAFLLIAVLALSESGRLRLSRP